MRAQVYIQVSLGLLSSRVACAKSAKGWATLSLGYVTQLTVEQDFTEPSTYCTLGTSGEGVLFNRVLYREAPPRGPTPYPFIYQQQRALFA